PPGYLRRGPEHQRSAHAVALGAELAPLVDLRLRIEESRMRHRVPLDRTSHFDRRGPLLDLRPVRGTVEIEMRGVLHDWRPRGTVVHVGNQYRVALRGQASTHLAKCRPQRKDIRPDEDPGVHTLRWMKECRIARSIGCFDLDVPLEHLRYRAERHPGRSGESDRCGRSHEFPARRLERISLRGITIGAAHGIDLAAVRRLRIMASLPGVERLGPRQHPSVALPSETPDAH